MDRVSIRVKEEGPITSIHMTSRLFGIPLFRVYAFFVDGLLVDTGFVHGRDGFLKVLDVLRPSAVVNTHHHEDHTGNNFWVTKKYGLIPLAHPKTSSYLKAPSQWMRLYRRVVWGTPEPSETAPVDSEIRTSRFRFLPIPTPGHSDDHLCLYEPDERWLFSGDLFIGEELRYLREDEDIYGVLDSLKRVAALPLKAMFCSFSGPINRPNQALDQKIDYLENLKDEIERGLEQGLSPQEIRRRLLGGGDRFRLVTAGQISKQNLINAFLRKHG
ncbi:MAG: MBL fold metallo-hydrolase [Syntrophaceae bacterium]|nr:MBL fold metallo-hydrolase [Syntrophaceae bacterium]